MTKVTEELLFKCFRGNTTENENKMIDRWIEKDEKNFAKYRNAYRIYEGFLLSDAYEDDIRQTLPDGRKHRALRASAIALGNIAAVVAVFFCSQHIIESRYEERIAGTKSTIVVPAGKSMDYILPDGSSVRLNSGTRLTYPVLFARDSREVSLEGEAYFDVRHNADRPFIVKTFASDIEVLGTEFNVNADEAENLFSTTLVEGSVKLTGRTDGKEIIMKPSQTVSLISGKLALDSTADPEIQWINGILAVSTHDFAGLMEKLETAFGVEIIIERDTMPEFDFIRGKFRISDGIDHALKVLQDMVDFTYKKDYTTGTIYIR